MVLTKQTVTEALKQVIDPNTGAIVAGRSIRNLSVQGGEVRFDVELGYPAKSQHEPIRALLSEAVAKLPGVERVAVTVPSKVVAHAVQQGVKLLPGRAQHHRRGLGQGRRGQEHHPR